MSSISPCQSMSPIAIMWGHLAQCLPKLFQDSTRGNALNRLAYKVSPLLVSGFQGRPDCKSCKLNVAILALRTDYVALSIRVLVFATCYMITDASCPSFYSGHVEYSICLDIQHLPGTSSLGALPKYNCKQHHCTDVRYGAINLIACLSFVRFLALKTEMGPTSGTYIEST